MRHVIAAACLFAALPAHAQRPIPVQNYDEPGRNPYQEAQLTSCSDAGNCAVTFAAVPASRRRVVTYANCEVDVTLSGALVGVNLGSQVNRLPRASLPFTSMPGLSTRSIVNTMTALYYEATEQPRIDVYTTMTGTPFLLCTLTGYDITLP